MRLLTGTLAVLLASLVGAYAPLGEVESTAQVLVTLFVMSRCPDAVKCEDTFWRVLQTKDLPEVALTLSYIGSLQEQPDGTTTVTCKHGAPECAGNVQQLCFTKYNPDHQVWFRFVNTLNTVNPWRIGDIEYAREVAKKIGAEANFDAVAQCAQSDEGYQLHVESIKRTMSAKVSTSCTVFIEGQKRCVVDGGVWRECPGGSRVEDFVESIRQEARRPIDNLRIHYQSWK
ncbi:hypothetical protein BGZ73_002484 [Actinomortierella ambigua]|nr:hypothetical protein BGZ73_002484 [Actinomortierella ambigua]